MDVSCIVPSVDHIFLVLYESCVEVSKTCLIRLVSYYHSLFHFRFLMDSAIKRGALIVFEGCDRSGKSTQCKKILDALSLDNVNVAADRFPGAHVLVICSICQHWILGFYTLFFFR